MKQIDLFPREGHDPGGKVRIKLDVDMVGDAGFSGPDDCYRTWLSRNWTPPTKIIDVDGYALWIGMNPSTADASVDDPTIKKEIKFTKGLGLGGLIKCNVMNFRATYPADLLKPLVIPRSDDNLPMIIGFALSARKIILCYGDLKPELRRYGVETVAALQQAGHELWCLGITNGGSPRHPLYVKESTSLVTLKEAQKEAHRLSHLGLKRS